MENTGHEEVKITPRYLVMATLENISQVILLENWVSGLMILIAITIANVQLGIVALLSAIIGTLVALAVGGDKSLIEKGLFGFNSVLTGLALQLFLTGSMRMVIALAAAAFVVVFHAAVMHFLKNLGMPVLTFPYIVLTWFLLLTSYHLGAFHLSSGLVPQDLTHWKLETGGAIDAINGLVSGIGQVYFQEGLIPGLIILLAIFWADRKLGIYAVIGTAVAWGAAIALGAEHGAINLGLFGYNAVLTILAIGAVFDANKPVALISGIAAALITVPITASMDTWLSIYGLPALTMPFVLVTWVFIAARKVLPNL